MPPLSHLLPYIIHLHLLHPSSYLNNSTPSPHFFSVQHGFCFDFVRLATEFLFNVNQSVDHTRKASLPTFILCFKNHIRNWKRGEERRQRITDSTSFLQIRQSDGYPEKKNKEKWNGIIHFFLLLSLPEENIEPKPKRFPEWTFRIGFTWTTLLYEPCTFFNGGFWYPIEDEQCCEFFGAFLWELCFWVTPSFDNVVRLIFGAEPVELLRDRSGNGHKLRV